VEADFQQYYQIDLADAVEGGGMSARRITALTFALPRESRLVRRLSDDAWPREHQLLGLIAEKVDSLHATTVRAAGGKVKGKIPEVVPRPKRGAAHAPPVATAGVVSRLDSLLAAARGGE
jgi:hypothetical protein